MNGADLMAEIGRSLFAGFLSVGLGLAYFRALRRGVDRLRDPHTTPWFLPLGGLLRVASAAMGIALAARLGAAALVASLLGFAAARYLSVRQPDEVAS